MSFTANSEGGEYKHRLSGDEMPSHIHILGKGNPDAHAFSWGKTGSGCVYLQNAQALAGNPPGNHAMTFQGDWNQTGASGGDNLHNNLQPYISVYFWKRTA